MKLKGVYIWFHPDGMLCIYSKGFSTLDTRQNPHKIDHSRNEGLCGCDIANWLKSSKRK